MFREGAQPIGSPRSVASRARGVGEPSLRRLPGLRPIALSLPVFDAADELLHPEPQCAETRRPLRGSVAAWTPAIGDDERVPRKHRRGFESHASMRDVDGAWDVLLVEGFGASRIDYDEPRGSLVEVGV